MSDGCSFKQRRVFHTMRIIASIYLVFLFHVLLVLAYYVDSMEPVQISH